MGDARLLCADSLLVVDGKHLARSVHEDRFARGVGLQGGDEDLARRWHREMVEAVPAAGAHFPRIDFRDDAEPFRFAMRSAPKRDTTVTLWSAHFDPRATPWIKGPDLAELAGLRLLAAEHGATEAAILDDDGHMIEGAYSAIVWWRDDALHVTPRSVPRVASVTEATLVTLCTAMGVEVREASVLPAELAGAEVWALSALHGVRGVTSWVDGPDVASPSRAPLWRARLDALRSAA